MTPARRSIQALHLMLVTSTTTALLCIAPVPAAAAQDVAPGGTGMRPDVNRDLKGRIKAINPRKKDIVQTLAPSKDQIVGPVEIDARLMELTELLDADDFDVRESAQQEIVDLLRDWRPAEQLLRTHEMTDEQRARLLEAIREHLLTKPRGALGISMDRRRIDANGMAEVRIMDIVPGLPAERVLRIGDRITHLDGIRLTSNEDLIRYVQYREPGDEIQVTIRRPQLVNHDVDDVAQQDTLEFTVMDVTLELGSADLLNRAGMAGESPVLVERRMQAQSIKRSHAMKARAVSFDSPLAEEFVFEPQRALELAEIDRAPEVALLLRQQEMVNSGQMELTPVLQRTWIDNLNRLRQMAMDPSLSEFQQLYLERIVERYEELIAP